MCKVMEESPVTASEGSEISLPTLKELLLNVSTRPGKGGKITRPVGWGSDMLFSCWDSFPLINSDRIHSSVKALLRCLWAISTILLL